MRKINPYSEAFYYSGIIAGSMGNNNKQTDKLDELEQKAGNSMARSSRKFMILLAVVGLCLVALHFSPAKELLTDIEQLKSDLRATGALAPIIFFIASAMLATIGFPRLGLTFAAGVLFGLKIGLPLALGSTLLGSYATFCAARWGGREWAERMAGKSRHLSFLLENQSLATVFLSRQLPITNIIINLGLSLTSVRHSTFLTGSLLGFIPAALVAALSGSSLGKSSAHISFFQFCLAGIIVIVSTATVWRLKKRWSFDYANKHS